MDDLSTVNAGQEVNVEPQTTGNVQSETVNAEQSGITNQRPVQTPEQNAMFASMRREAEQRAKDAVISEMGYTYNGQPITTYSQYQEALAEQKAEEEAQKIGVDPQFYQEFNSMKTKLSSIEREKTLIEQEHSLESDPKVGELFKQWKTDIQTFAQKANCDYDTAFTIVARQKLPDLLMNVQQKGEQEAVKKLLNNAQSSPGALGESGNMQKPKIKDMSKDDFEKLRDSALRGEIKSL